MLYLLFNFYSLDKLGNADAGGARDVLAVDLDDAVPLLESTHLGWRSTIYTTDLDWERVNDGETIAVLATVHVDSDGLETYNILVDDGDVLVV